MLNSILKKDYFQNEHKIILPKEAGEDNQKYAYAVAADFAANGFPMDEDTLTLFSQATVDDIVAFHKEYLPILKDAIGNNCEYRPFYPNFPEQVMEYDDLEIFIHQVIYGLSGFKIKPELFTEAKQRFPFVGEPIKHMISVGSEDDYRECMKNLMASAISYSNAQRKAIARYINNIAVNEEHLPNIESLKNHENRVILACILEDAGKTQFVSKILVDATDALRYAAVRSAERATDYSRLQSLSFEVRIHGKDSERVKDAIYKYASLQFTSQDTPNFRLSRKQRKVVAGILEQSAKGNPKKLAGEMCSHKKEWKMLIKNLHVADTPEYKTLNKAAELISTNAKGINPRGGVEEAIKEENLEKALVELKNKPGEFVRRFDKLIRMAIKLDKEDNEVDVVGTRAKAVLSELKTAVKSAGIQTLYSLDAHVSGRSEDDQERVFVIPKSTSVKIVEDKNRTGLPDQIIRAVWEILADALFERFAGKESMGNVYISHLMGNYYAPIRMRETSDGMKTYGPGSVIPLYSSLPVKRLFVHWTNMKNGSRVDLDLSVTLFDENMELVGVVGWNANKADRIGKAYVFSGDVQDGQEYDGAGVAEFVDLDLPKLKALGVRYIMPSVDSYTCQPFSRQDHVSFGIMERDLLDGRGELFEPQTVSNRMQLTANATTVIPFILDLEKDCMTWIDQPYQGRIASQNTSLMRSIAERAMERSYSFESLICLNVKANGTPVEDPEEADLLFITEEEHALLKEEFPDFDDGRKIVYPHDMSYIVGVLMAEGPGKSESN